MSRRPENPDCRGLAGPRPARRPARGRRARGRRARTPPECLPLMRSDRSRRRMPDARKASEARTQGARVSGNTWATEDAASRRFAAVQAPPHAAGRAAKLDVVTVDAFGTMLELVEPYDRLRAALAARGMKRDRE